MYAVVETQGKQYRVGKGDALLVDRLAAGEGEVVSLRAVAFRDKEMVLDPKALEKVTVEAKVAEHLRGPKVRVLMYKKKKGYRRHAGHRSELTRLEVTGITTGSPGSSTAAKKPAAKKPAAKPAARPAAKPAAKKPPAKKPPAKKPAANQGAGDGS